MKKAVTVVVFIALAGSLYGQDVAELSRREKARREGLMGNRAKVVTNADLAAVRKMPAILNPPTDLSSDQNAPGVESAESSGLTLRGAADSAAPRVMVPTVISDGPALFGEGAVPGPPPTEKDLENKLRAAEELAGLLTDKMNILLQESNDLNTMTPRDVIMQQIDETSQKLAQAQDDVAKLKTQLDAARKNPQERR